MNLGPVIDVATGLIFVYLLLGLIASALQELVASALTWRSKLLTQVIIKLFADKTNGKAKTALAAGLLDHGLVHGGVAGRAASYVPSKAFTLALVDTLSQGSAAPAFKDIRDTIAKLPESRAKDSLLAFANDCGGDLDKFKASVATWFDDTMDRVSGMYKRRSQIFAIVFGLVIAIVLNVDSVRIGTKLWTDDALRSNIAAAAQAYAATCPNAECQAPAPAKQPAGAGAAPSKDLVTARQSIDGTIAKLTDLKLPIGWNVFGEDIAAAAAAPASGAQVPAKQEEPSSWPYFTLFGLQGILVILLGWIITGVATSLGAPFWFDLLKNVLSLRGAGPKPARADGTGSNA